MPDMSKILIEIELKQPKLKIASFQLKSSFN